MYKFHFEYWNKIYTIAGHIKLIDFGTCKLGILGEKRTNSLVGTLDYIAPGMIPFKKM